MVGRTVFDIDNRHFIVLYNTYVVLRYVGTVIVQSVGNVHVVYLVPAATVMTA